MSKLESKMKNVELEQNFVSYHFNCSFKPTLSCKFQIWVS